MAKLTLEDLANLNNPTSAVTSINANNALIEDALENTLSLDGTSPNAMNANLDMNGFAIINIEEVTTGGLTLATSTLSANAATLASSVLLAQITSESLTTAAGSSQAFTITRSGITTSDTVFIQYSAGTNTRRRLGFRTVCTTNTITVTVDNHEASNAFNGTLIFFLRIMKGA